MGKAEWTGTVQDLICSDRWIIHGNYGGTLDIRVGACDTLIPLDHSPVLYRFRVAKRWLKHRGTTRPDMAPMSQEKLDYEFLKWIWRFRMDERPRMMEKATGMGSDSTLVILRTPAKTRRFVRRLREEAGRAV